MPKKLFDVIYIVKEDARNEELRYSLRSVCENFPVRNVWIFGYVPLWLKEVIGVSIPQTGNKWENSKMLFNYIANCKSVPDEFFLFNDDFFVMEKITNPKNYYCGKLQDRIDELKKKAPNNPMYSGNLQKVENRLQEYGRKNNKNYAVHKPMKFNRALLAYSLTLTEDLPMSLRSFYGNYYGLRGLIDAPDCKVFTLGEYKVDGPYLSTDDRTFRLGRVGRDIRAKFPNKCKYER